MSTYFDELTARLNAAGMPDDRVKATVEELTSYLADSGGDPVDEFGPAADLARDLAGSASASGEPAGDARTWRWTADLFHDVRMLNEYGAQGWEVQKVDRSGLFNSTRDPDRPQQWEYRREPRGHRARLAPEGWEPCGGWVVWEYFKRPKATTLGPAAELTATPPQPERGVFLSPRFFAFVAAMVAIMVAIAATVVLLIGSLDISGHGLSTVLGLVTGAAAGAAISVAVLWLLRRRR
ncbi:hypothetical protein [Actinocorallia aurantiaca]|uniref:DUF2812 domain-containing protein n=1 Tax=Actinocorallia aurantiaca TaxID=46204 RepID=A0ABP6GES9_9ACTN